MNVYQIPVLVAKPKKKIKKRKHQKGGEVERDFR
jgi:hypothetical protein